MRFIGLISVIGLWGCSKEVSVSCPRAVCEAFESTLQGKTTMKEVDWKHAKSQEESLACSRMVSNDIRTWKFFYGAQGQTKMDNFLSLDSEKQQKIGNILLNYLVLKSVGMFEPKDLEKMDKRIGRM
jgi:hypothetical protein